jgi:Fur family ferric uptake transcriptional regulator
MEDHLAQQLRAGGYRLTPQRLAILQILDDTGDHLSPVEVFERAREKMPGLTEATVYRTLSFLHRQGILLAGHIGNGNLVYEVASHQHHHLICRECGESLEIGHDALDDLYARLKKETGFALDESHVTLFGLCPICQ